MLELKLYSLPEARYLYYSTWDVLFFQGHNHIMSKKNN